jgi:acetyl esterase/lipase
MTNSNITRLILTTFLFFFVFSCFGQDKQNADTLRKAYDADMKSVSNVFSANYYPNRQNIYSLNETLFLKKIDSLKQPFLDISKKYTKQFQFVDRNFIPNEVRDVLYFFDRMIVDYTYFHENYTGNKIKLSKSVQNKLDNHSKDFNNPALLSSKDFKDYLEAFLRHQTTIELEKAKYKKSDNKRLDAYLSIIPKYFINKECKEFWQHHYLFAHLDNFGSKNTEQVVKSFLSTCKNTNYTKVIDSIYTASTNSYKGHIIKTYKTVNSFNLDLHIFLPDSLSQKTKRPVIVYFHGGSWTEGTPEWDFWNCSNYAKQGWVAVAVEYRIADRHETTPFEAVKDAKSAIRWLRMNAELYNIDTARIVASGNSAGGHLVLTTAMAGEINEKTDNLNYSASPNILLINSGVFNITVDGGTAWISKNLTDKSFVQKISPQHLLRKGLPPMLIIHGTNDQSVDYSSAKSFADEMEIMGNDFEFHTLEGAHHYIWYDRRFSGKVAEFRKEFLKKYGFE